MKQQKNERQFEPVDLACRGGFRTLPPQDTGENLLACADGRGVVPTSGRRMFMSWITPNQGFLKVTLYTLVVEN